MNWPVQSLFMAYHNYMFHNYRLTTSNNHCITIYKIKQCELTPYQDKSTNSLVGLMGFRVGVGEEEVVMEVLVKLTVVSAGYHKHTMLS